MHLGRVPLALLVAAVATVVAYGLARLGGEDGPVAALEAATVDWRLRMTAAAEPEARDVALVMFDEEAVEGWPFLTPVPRGMLGDIVAVSSAIGASAIGLDVYLDRRYPELESFDGGDARLREAISDAGNVVLGAPLEWTADGWKVVPPDPYFGDVAAAVGAAEIPVAFSQVRESLLAVRTVTGLVPGFALALYAVHQGLPLDSLLAAAERTGRIELPGLPARYRALEPDGPTYVPIRYLGPPSRPLRSNEPGDNTFLTYASDGLAALADLVALPQGAALLEGFFPVDGNPVLVGSAAHSEERFRSPFYSQTSPEGEIHGWTYAVEIQATALQNLLSGQFAVPVHRAVGILVLLAAALLTALATVRFGVLGGVAGGALAWAAVTATATIAFDRDAVVLPVVTPGLGIVLSFLVGAYVALVLRRESAASPGGGVVDFFRELSSARLPFLYVVSAWVVIDVAETVFPLLGLPEWTLNSIAVLAVAGFPIALLAAWRIEASPRRRHRQVAGRRTWAGRGRVGGAAAGSLAVAGFTTTPDDARLRAFADGLTDDLVADLMARPSVRVRASAIGGGPARAEGALEGVGEVPVLRGTVRGDEARVRVVAQLVDADGEYLWTRAYDRPLDPPLDVQARLGAEIAAAAVTRLVEAGALPTSAETAVDPLEQVTA